MEEKERERKRTQALIRLAAQRTRRLSTLQAAQADAVAAAAAAVAAVEGEEDTQSQSSASISLELSAAIEEEFQRGRAAILADPSMASSSMPLAANDSLATAATMAPPRPKIHTALTTGRAVRAYRLTILHYFVVYIKVVPSGYIKKIVAHRGDTIANLYHRLHSCAQSAKEVVGGIGGSGTGGRLLLPTSCGLFELHPGIAIESDYYIADRRGADVLEAFGMKRRGAAYSLIYAPRYHTASMPQLLRGLLLSNTILHTAQQLPIYSGVDRLPADVEADGVQTILCALLKEHYHLQQLEERKAFQQLAVNHRRTVDRTAIRGKAIEKRQRRDRALAQRTAARRAASQSKARGGTPLPPGAQLASTSISVDEGKKDWEEVLVDELDSDYSDEMEDEEVRSLSDVRVDGWSDDEDYDDEEDKVVELDNLEERQVEDEPSIQEPAPGAVCEVVPSVTAEGISVPTQQSTHASPRASLDQGLLQGSVATALARSRATRPSSPSHSMASSAYFSQAMPESASSSDSDDTSSLATSLASSSYATASTYSTTLPTSSQASSSLSSLGPLQLHAYVDPQDDATAASQIFADDHSIGDVSLFSGNRPSRRAHSGRSGVYSHRPVSATSTIDDVSEYSASSAPSSARSDVSSQSATSMASSQSSSTGGGLFTYRSHLSSASRSSTASSTATGPLSPRSAEWHLWQSDVSTASAISYGSSSHMPLSARSESSVQWTARSSDRSASEYSQEDEEDEEWSDVGSEDSDHSDSYYTPRSMSSRSSAYSASSVGSSRSASSRSASFSTSAASRRLRDLLDTSSEEVSLFSAAEVDEDTIASSSMESATMMSSSSSTLHYSQSSATPSATSSIAISSTASRQAFKGFGYLS